MACVHTTEPASAPLWREEDGLARATVLIETAKLNDVDPRAWLADVLKRLPNHPVHAHLGQLLLRDERRAACGPKRSFKGPISVFKAAVVLDIRPPLWPQVSRLCSCPKLRLTSADWSHPAPGFRQSAGSTGEPRAPRAPPCSGSQAHSSEMGSAQHWRAARSNTRQPWTGR